MTEEEKEEIQDEISLLRNDPRVLERYRLLEEQVLTQTDTSIHVRD